MKLHPYLKPLTKINPKSIKDLKLLEETVRKCPCHWSWQHFFGWDTKNTSNKSKNKWDYIKLKRCCAAKKTNHQNENATY